MLNLPNRNLRYFTVTWRLNISLTAQERELFQPRYDPLTLRERYLPRPSLSSPSSILKTSNPKINSATTQVESSDAHRKSNAGLCGLTGDSQTLVISSVLQYYSQIPYYQQLLRASRLHHNRN